MLKAELKSLWHNKLLILIVAAIILIPSIYAGFFLSSMWDPYGDLEYLPVAVVNNDKAVTYNDEELAIGDSLAENLADNDSMAFNVVDEDVAMKGLKNGTYYMVITIPENFSENATTLMDDEPQQMKLEYITNPGNNYISMKLGESAMKTIQANINEEVTRTYAENVFDSIGDVETGFHDATDGTQKMLDGEDQLVDGNELITENLLLLEDGSKTLKDGTHTLSQGANTLNNSMGQLTSGAGELAGGVGQYTDGVSQLSSGISTLKEGTGTLASNVPALTKGVGDLKNGADQITAGYEGDAGAVKGSADLANGMKQVNQAVQAISLPDVELSDAQKNQITTQAASVVTSQSAAIKAQAEAAVDAKAAEIKASAQAAATSQVGATSPEEKAQLIEAGKISGNNAAAASIPTLKNKVSDLVDTTAGLAAQKAMSDVATSFSGGESACTDAATAAQAAADAATNAGASFDGVIGILSVIDRTGMTAEQSAAIDSAISAANTAKSSFTSPAGTLISQKAVLDSSATALNGYATSATAEITTASSYAAGVVKANPSYSSLGDGIDAIVGGSFASGYGAGTIANAGTIAYSAVRSASGEIAVSAATSASKTAAVAGAQGVATEVNNQLGAFSGQLGTLKAATNQLDAGAGRLNVGINQLYAGTKQVDTGLTTLNGSSVVLAEGVNQLDAGASQLVAGANQLTENSGKLNAGAAGLSNGTLQVADAVSQIAAGSNKLDKGAGEITDGAAKLHDGSKELGDGLVELQDGTVTLHDALADGAKEVGENKASDESLDMFSAPVTIEESKMTTVENNGHGMAAYMMSVGLWVGCLAFCLMYPLTEYHGDFKNGFQWWLSKAVIAAPAGTLMVVVLMAVMSKFLGFAPGSVGKTFLVALFAVTAFMCIQYFFDILFGRVGSFLMLIFMVLQLTGSAGTYPIEISGDLAKVLHAWMPFTYSVNGFRAAIAAGETASIMPQLTVLGGIAVVFTILTVIVFQIRGKCILNGKTMLYDWIEEKGLA